MRYFFWRVYVFESLLDFFLYSGDYDLVFWNFVYEICDLYSSDWVYQHPMFSNMRNNPENYMIILLFPSYPIIIFILTCIRTTPLLQPRRFNLWNSLVNMYNTIVFVKNDMIINRLLLKCMWPKFLDRLAENIRLGRKLSTVATFSHGSFL